MKPFFATIIALLAAILFVTPLRAGPPLICHQIDIGDAKSLPWGKDAFDKRGSYDVNQLPKDTLAILTADASILVRMETLRRAAVYVGQNREVAETLLGQLMARIIDAEAAGKPDALAYFDAGYLSGCYDQCGVETAFGPAAQRGDGRGASGYAWLTRAIAIGGESKAIPQMHLGAALALADSREKAAQKEHIRAALVAGVGNDSKAERSLLEWIAIINGTTLDSLRAELGLAKASADSGR